MSSAAGVIRPRHVVFDFGGVLFEWEPHELLARLLPAHAPTPAAALALRQGFFQGYGGDWAEFDRGTVDAPELAERIAQRLPVSVDEARRVIDAVPDALVPLAGTVDLLRRLHAGGVELYYLSNMPAPYATELEARHDFIDHFRAGVFSSRVQLIKPEPAIYALALERFGIADPASLLFIDDLEENVAAARAAGWQALRFENAAQCEAALRRLGVL